MSAIVKAARTTLEKSITAAMDEAKGCRATDCPHCARAVEFAMKMADLYAYAALEADQPGAAP